VIKKPRRSCAGSGRPWYPVPALYYRTNNKVATQIVRLVDHVEPYLHHAAQPMQCTGSHPTRRAVQPLAACQVGLDRSRLARLPTIAHLGDVGVEDDVIGLNIIFTSGN